MFSRKQKHIMLKFFSLFSVVRGYNILVIIIAQYLASIYILAPNLPVGKVLFDVNVLMLVLASTSAIAAGYIINSFYDSDKDFINRPTKTVLDRLVSQNTKLSGYFILNFLSLVFASYVSFRAVLFFSLYIFAIWFYSHKLKKFLFIGNITAAILAVIPFFAVFIYYRNFNNVIFVHATFLFLLIAMKDLTKDLENIKGDLAQDYKTIPVVYGVSVAKIMLTALSVATLVPVALLLMYFSIGYMNYYFYGSIVALFVFEILLWNSNKRAHYLTLHNILKFIIVAGVFSIVLINVNLVLSRVF
jgi:4-hydroxybenzoate polyprenyltransferase